MRSSAVVAVLILVGGHLHAQAPARDTTGARLQASQPANAPKRDFRRISGHAAVSGVYDSNLYHTEEEVHAQGLVTAVGLHFQSAESRPAVQIDYLAALHSYTRSDRWDRLSHSVRAVSARRVSKVLELETVGEMSLKGSSEDRDLGNQYVLSPRLEYRINKESRLRFTTTYRLKDPIEAEAPIEHNRYVQLEFRQRFDEQRWEAGYRLERNESRNARRDYSRSTFTTGYSTELAEGNELAMEMKYRVQTYTGRTVEIEDADVLRRDHRVIPSVSWARRLPLGATGVLEYQYETRSSNDPEKGYNAHLLMLTMKHLLW